MGKASYGMFLGGLPRGLWRPSEGPRRRHWNILAFYREVRQLGYLAFGSHFSWAEGGSCSLGAFNTQPAPPHSPPPTSQPSPRMPPGPEGAFRWRNTGSHGACGNCLQRASWAELGRWPPCLFSRVSQPCPLCTRTRGGGGGGLFIYP